MSLMRREVRSTVPGTWKNTLVSMQLHVLGHSMSLHRYLAEWTLQSDTPISTQLQRQLLKNGHVEPAAIVSVTDGKHTAD